MNKKLKPVSREEIEETLKRKFEGTHQRPFLGAGRRYFDRGTPGYKDNLIPIGGRRPVEAVKKIDDGNNRVVDVLDVGCANGQPVVDLLTYLTKKGFRSTATAIAGNKREFLENPPVDGIFYKTDLFSYAEGRLSTHDLVFPIGMPDGTENGGRISYIEGDMHRVSADIGSYDVIMSMAAIKYTHDPLRVFANLMRSTNPEGYLFIGHLLNGVKTRTSRHPTHNITIYDQDGKEMSPRELMDSLQECNPGYTFISNEDRSRRVRDQNGNWVLNEERFYAHDRQLNAYRESLIQEMKDAKTRGDESARSKASLELSRVSGNGFFNVSVKAGEERPYIGLVYVGDNYGDGASYMFVPRRDDLRKLEKSGYVVV